MADRAHAYHLVDLLTSYRTALRGSARQLRAAIDNAPANPSTDERTKEALKSRAGEIRAAAADILAIATELEGRF